MRPGHYNSGWRTRALLLGIFSMPPALALAQVSYVGPPGYDERPVFDQVSFWGNAKLPTSELAAVVQVKAGGAASGSAITPDLERLTALYRSRGLGDVVVVPDVAEERLNHIHLTYRIYESGRVPMEMTRDGIPKFWLDRFVGNTLICASAGTSNDLCHELNRADGTLVQVDQNGPHAGHWTVGPVQPDGRVPICQYWDTGRIVMPPELMPPQAPWPKGSLCTSKNFQTRCEPIDDVTKLDAEGQRKARRTMAQRFQEEGVCYSHGDHAVGTAWFEYGTPLPGQLQLDRLILLPGHQ